MGLTGSKRCKTSSIEISGNYDFEVYVPQYEDNTRYSSNLSLNTWSSLQFSHGPSTITVTKEGLVLESIQLDHHFEIINEQPDELIFTIKFSSDNQSFSRWKVRCKSIHEYSSWTKFLKKSLRKSWIDSKRCQRCSKPFKLFLRKHHCRKCGECICDECSPIRSTLPELAYKDMVRICLRCGSEIEQNRKGKSLSNTPNFRDQRKNNLL